MEPIQNSSLAGSFSFVEQELPVSEECNSLAFLEVQSTGACMEKLRADEARIQAEMMQLQERLTRIKEIALSIKYLPKERGFPILEKIANVDFHLAKTIVDSWKNEPERCFGYIFLARFAKKKKAAQLLNQVKTRLLNEDEKNFYEFPLLLKIYQEEKRRGFPKAEETFAQLLQQLQVREESFYVDTPDIAKVWFAYQYQVPNKEEFLSDLLPKINGGGSLFDDLEKMEGWPQEVFDSILSASRERMKKNFTEGDYGKRGWIHDWSTLLQFEGKHPELQDMFQQDLEYMFELIENIPEEDRSWKVRDFIETIAPIAPDQAERFLKFIDPETPSDELRAKVAIFIGKTKNPEFDRKKEFAKFKNDVRVRDFYFHCGNGENCFGLFKVAYAVFGEEKADPYFYEALLNYIGISLSTEIHLEQPDSPLKGTLFAGLNDRNFAEMLSALTPTQLEIKEEAVQAALKLHKYKPFDPLFLEKLLEAEVSLL